LLGPIHAEVLCVTPQAGARRKPLHWQEDGRTPDAEAGYDDVWEVICPCTGDDGGPAELQSPDVQRFRGPYRTEDAARMAAHQHNVVAHW
jgi:hypothetical protein